MKKRQKLFSLTKEDFVFKATKGSGNGGQKRNKTSSAMYCTHPPSGAQGYSEESREQSRNKQLAFKRCTETALFKSWLQLATDIHLDKVDVQYQDETGKTIKRKATYKELLESKED